MPKRSPRTSNIRRIIILLLVVLLALLVWFNYPLLYYTAQQYLAFQTTQPPAVSQPTPVATTNIAQPSATLTASATPAPLHTATIILSTVTPSQTPDRNAKQNVQEQPGIFVMSMADGNYYHLFAYHPQFMPLTRLTNSPWDDIAPSVSADGSRIVYSSHQSGHWDLFLLDLASGQTFRLTNTPNYDGAPCLSPDGEWVVYESYQNNTIDIFLRSIKDLSQPPIQLTDGPGLSYAPVWSPKGREIAFISTRSGEGEVWIAQLDVTEDRFLNVSQNSYTQETHPFWSPDGNYLVWSAEQAGQHNIYIKNRNQLDSLAYFVGNGSLPVWSPDNTTIASEILLPNRTSLTGYQITSRTIAFPLSPLPGSLRGLDWKAGQLVRYVSAFKISQNPIAPEGPIWQPILTLTPPPPNGRFGVVHLQDVSVAYPFLHDAVDESFARLRSKTAYETGWDFLSNLENAFLPITAPQIADMSKNWLYTGRAFAVNTLPLSANWMAITREDFYGQTYWRVYLKARFQDGSQGLPLVKNSWDMASRYSGNPLIYEQGGQNGAIPEGYWIDFTDLALRYGWERLPSLINWRTYYPAARFNQFLLSGGVDWDAAMAEIYPPEARRVATYAASPTGPASMVGTPTRRVTWTPQP